MARLMWLSRNALDRNKLPAIDEYLETVKTTLAEISADVGISLDYNSAEEAWMMGRENEEQNPAHSRKK